MRCDARSHLLGQSFEGYESVIQGFYPAGSCEGYGVQHGVGVALDRSTLFVLSLALFLPFFFLSLLLFLSTPARSSLIISRIGSLVRYGVCGALFLICIPTVFHSSRAAVLHRAILAIE